MLFRSAAGALSKTGVGNLVLSGANTYSGRTLVSGGQLFLANAATLAGGSSLEISGGTVDLLGNSQSGANTLGAVTVAGGSLLASATTLANAGTLAGTAFTFGYDNGGITDSVATVKLSGTNLTKVSPTRTLTLWNANTFTGTVYHREGTLYLNNAGAVGGATTLE